MKHLFGGLKLKFNIWKRTRRAKPTDRVGLTIPFDDDQSIHLVMPGDVYVAFVRVEETLAAREAFEQLAEFYLALIELSGTGRLTTANVLLYLHPEAYVGLAEIAKRMREAGAFDAEDEALEYEIVEVEEEGDA